MSLFRENGKMDRHDHFSKAALRFGGTEMRLYPLARDGILG
jgi:hypothetical protein